MFLCFRADQGRLLDYIVSWGNLTEDKVACYLREILEALHYLHNSRIVHLDVKVRIFTLFLLLCLGSHVAYISILYHLPEFKRSGLTQSSAQICTL